MDFKTMLMSMAEEQANKMQDEAMSYITSDEFCDMIATKINEKINIPFVSEEKEQLLFEKIVDVVTDLMEGVFRSK
jgi:hypothetical protein